METNLMNALTKTESNIIISKSLLRTVSLLLEQLKQDDNVEALCVLISCIQEKLEAAHDGVEQAYKFPGGLK